MVCSNHLQARTPRRQAQLRMPLQCRQSLNCCLLSSSSKQKNLWWTVISFLCAMMLSMLWR